jgi:hypothetical protein
MPEEKIKTFDIDSEIQNAHKMKKIFLGLSAMWRRKADAIEKRVKNFERYKKNPGLFRVKENRPASAKD